MNKIQELIRYILNNYPYAEDLSKTRITKLAYLSDWCNTRQNGKQITSIKWYFDHYGPYVTDVVDAAEHDEDIEISKTFSMFGSPKLLVTKKNQTKELSVTGLSSLEKQSIDKVIEETKQLNFNEFIDFVYSTYPIVNTKKYNFLELSELAYQEESSKNS